MLFSALKQNNSENLSDLCILRLFVDVSHIKMKGDIYLE